MPDLMTKEEGEELGRLLTKVWEVNQGFIPDSAYRPLQKIVSWAAIEVLIVRNNGREALLRHRSDPPWNGWHVPGGYVRPGESIQAFCNRSAKEDAGISGGVFNIRHILTTKWLDHPFTWPFCIMNVCEVRETVQERDDLRFFSVEEFPLDQMLHPKHVMYLEMYAKYLENPWPPCPIIGEVLSAM